MANEMILVVDADKKSQKVLEVCFKKAGYRVVLADSIVQAMRYVEQTPPSLIISDTVLADGDGLEFCADLKHNPTYKEIPFVFLTEDRSLPQKMRGFELGADDYLTKPIYIKEVTTRIELLLQKRANESLLEAGAEDFEGDLSDITMIDLLQNIEGERLSGSVLIRRGTRQAIVYFREGNLLDAICGKLQGEDAIYRVMMWSEGRFVVRYHEHSRRVDHIEKSTDALLLEGIHRLDEWNELVAELPSMDYVFALDYQKIAGQIDDFPGEVEQVVRLFDGYRTLYDVVDDSPLEDIVTLHIIGKLLDEGMLNNVTPVETPALNTTVLDASGLSAWLSNDLRDTNPGLPFRQLDLDQDASEDSGKSKLPDDMADEVATVDLRRPAREQAGEASDEPGTGGGHWKFHWEEDLADLEDGYSDEDEQVSSTSRIAGDAVRTRELVDEDSSQGVSSDVSDSLREVEARETIRRAEEARRLAEQMRQIDENTAQKQLKSVPVSVDAQEDPAEESADESEDLDAVVARVDSTQELFVQQILDEEGTREVEYEARSRASTPLSTPAQMIRGLAGSAVDAEWDSFETAEDEQELAGDSPVVYAARDAVEAREPVFVEGDVEAGGAEAIEVEEDRVEADSAEAGDLEAGEAEAGEAEAGEAEVGDVADVSSDDPAERREQSIEDAAVVSQEARQDRAEKITVPMNTAALRAELANEEAAQASAEESVSQVSQSIEEETSPEEDAEQEHRVASAFEAVEEFEAPLFDSVELLTTSLQSPPEGEVVRVSFDLKKSGYQNVRGMVMSLADERPESTEPGAAAVESAVEDVAESSDSADSADSPEETSEETSEETTSEKAAKPTYETAELPKVVVTKLAESAEEDSFFSNIEDPLYDEPRAASSNWKVPVLIVGILALLVVLTWNGMKSSKPEPAVDVKSEPVAEVSPAPVEPVEQTPEPESEPKIGELEESLPADAVAGLDEAAALAKASADSESVEESARGLSESLGAELAEEAAAAETLAAEEAAAAETLAAEKLAAEKLAASKVVAKEDRVEEASAAPATFDDKVRQLRNLIKRERTGDALKLARTLSAESPTDRSVAFLHGQAALYERQNSEAIENLARAEKLGMRTSALYLELGQAYQLAGQTDRAKQSYEAFLQIQPEGRSADEVRSILKNQF